jgi:hypothetical protein
MADEDLVAVDTPLIAGDIADEVAGCDEVIHLHFVHPFGSVDSIDEDYVESGAHGHLQKWVQIELVTRGVHHHHIGVDFLHAIERCVSNVFVGDGLRTVADHGDLVTAAGERGGNTNASGDASTYTFRSGVLPS